MTKKGRLAEIISNAVYNDDLDMYEVGYVDYQDVKEIKLAKFLEISENFQCIPASRIVYVKRQNRILFKKEGLLDKDGNPRKDRRNQKGA